jgi:hypothetical protein
VDALIRLGCGRTIAWHNHTPQRTEQANTRNVSTVDRQIVYPGAIPLDTDLLTTQRNIMVAIGGLAQATLGTNVVADGLACSPTQPQSMTVSIGPGSITQYGVVDTLPYGSLPAEPAEPLLRMATSLLSVNFQLTAPTGAGEAINYLIEASLLETDTTPVVLPYYNAANPSQPYSGPGGDGATQNSQRLQQVQFQLKAGAPSPVGSQGTPSVDAGWVGLYVITVQTGQSGVGSSNILQSPGAPFLPWKLPQLSPGTHNLAAFTPITQGTWTVPNGTTAVRLRIWGGGGAGGAGNGGAGGGGAGGGYSEGFYAVSAGESFFVTVGNGGIGTGTAGGLSGFGTIASSTGGSAGSNGSAGTIGAGGMIGGEGAGSGFLAAGQPGGIGVETGAFALSGSGGGSFGCAGGTPVASVTGGPALPGYSCALAGGGSGGVLSGLGGQGGPGLVLVEW